MINYQGHPPSLNLTVSPDEGTKDTNFTFTVKYRDVDNDPPRYVKISFNEGPWREMRKKSKGIYTYVTSLQPGLYSIRCKTSDGINMVYSEELQKPMVYSKNASQPDWETFLKIKERVEENYNLTIIYREVVLRTKEGKLVWEVSLPQKTVYVNYKGTEIIKEKDTKVVRDALIIIALIVGLALIIISLRIRKEKGR